MKQEGEDLAADTRARTLALEVPASSAMFEHVYSEAHSLMEEQAAWLAGYEASFEGGDA